MTRNELAKILRSKNACDEARDWFDSTPGSVVQLWAKCRRGDWMLWIAGRADVDRKALVRAACECARLSLRYVPKGEDRPRVAIKTAKAWTRGEATIEQVRAASAASYAVIANAPATAAAAYAYAASAASYAVIANAPAHAAAAAAYAYAAYAAYAAAAATAATADARIRRLAKCAAIVRKHITAADVVRALERT